MATILDLGPEPDRLYVHCREVALTPGPTAPARLGFDVLPATLRDLDMPNGCAADYDRWLAEAV